MSFLRKRGPKPAEIPQFTGLQVQTSSSAIPITIVYGINKVAPNVLWYGNFGSFPEYSKTGGKGGGRQTLTGYRYHASIILGLCEGPITSIGAVWKDQGVYAPWQLGFVQVDGTATQGLSSLVVATAPGQALAYRGVAYAASYFYELGSSATIGALQFEVYGLKYLSAAVNAHDADPAEVIYDFLTNVQYGVQFPADSIDGPTLLGPSGGFSLQAYCRAVGIAISPVLANKESASSILTRWMQLTNSAAIWSGGKLKIIPYGDRPVIGSLFDGTEASYVPEVAPIYSLADDDFVIDGDDDPVQIERKDPYAAFNVQQIEIAERANGYNSTTVTAWDQNSIEVSGRREGSTVTAHEICDKAIAQKVAQLILQREIYIRNTYSFRLSFEYCLLEPMDVVTLTDRALGLSNTPVRILSIEEGDDGILDVTGEEFPEGAGTAIAYPVEGARERGIDRNVVPSAINAPVIFEPPPALTDGQREIWVAVSGGLPMTFKLAETASAGVHLAAATLVPRDRGTIVSFSAHVRADERNACRLEIFDGVASQGTSFDLSSRSSRGSTSGIVAASLSEIDEGPWYIASVSCAMAASAAPVASIMLEGSGQTTSYVGTVGYGLFVWSPRFGVDGGAASALSVPLAPTGASLDPDGVDPPSGGEGTADPYWGGCIVHISTDDTTYGRVGQIDGPARHGVLTGALPAFSGASPDTGNTLTVTLSESGGELASASFSDARNGVTLSLVGDELVSYGTAALTGPNAYDLGYLMRGLHGTPAHAHASGERFVRIDDAIFKYVLPSGYVGQTLYLKFQSFNIFGQALQDLSTCATYVYVPNGAGAGPGPVTVALSIGTSLDLGAASEVASTYDDFGLASDQNVSIIDLGLAST